MPRANAAHSYRHEVIGRVESRAPDSDRTGLTDPPEDWPAALPPWCRRRDSTRATIARSASVALMLYLRDHKSRLLARLIYRTEPKKSEKNKEKNLKQQGSASSTYWLPIFHPVASPFFFFFYLFSSPILSRRILDVYHTSIHGVALVRI